MWLLFFILHCCINTHTKFIYHFSDKGDEGGRTSQRQHYPYVHNYNDLHPCAYIQDFAIPNPTYTFLLGFDPFQKIVTYFMLCREL